MAVLKKYNLGGEEIGQVSIEDDMLKSSANSQMIKDYIVALRENARQWSANTKTRAEVNHSGKKPHPQKGTGGARQGYLGSPQYKGGGRVHAPRPKFDQHIRVNKKEKRAAIRHLLIEKILDNRLLLLQLEGMEKPKTKTVAEFLRNRTLEGKKVLFLGEGVLTGTKKDRETDSSTNKLEAFIKSIRNLPKSEFMFVPNISGYDIIVNHELIVIETAFDQFKVLLGRQK